MALDEGDALHTVDGTGRLEVYLADAQLVLADAHDIALDQLPTASGFNVPVHLHATVGEQRLRVGSGDHDVSEFEELTEPDERRLE